MMLNGVVLCVSMWIVFFGLCVLIDVLFKVDCDLVVVDKFNLIVLCIVMVVVD